MTTEKDIRGMISYAKEEGHAAGVAEGESRGSAAAKLEIARNLLQQGLSIENIATATGLSLRQIQAL